MGQKASLGERARIADTAGNGAQCQRPARPDLSCLAAGPPPRTPGLAAFRCSFLGCPQSVSCQGNGAMSGSTQQVVAGGSSVSCRARSPERACVNVAVPDPAEPGG